MKGISSTRRTGAQNERQLRSARPGTDTATSSAVKPIAESNDLGQRGGERQHLARKVDLRHQVRVAGQAVGGEAESPDEERPGHRLDRDAHLLPRHERPAADERHGEAHQRAGRDDQDRHEDCPHEPHHRLLVPDPDVAARQLVEQPAMRPQLVMEDEAQVAEIDRRSCSGSSQSSSVVSYGQGRASADAVEGIGHVGTTFVAWADGPRLSQATEMPSEDMPMRP